MLAEVGAAVSESRGALRSAGIAASPGSKLRAQASRCSAAAKQRRLISSTGIRIP